MTPLFRRIFLFNCLKNKGKNVFINFVCICFYLKILKKNKIYLLDAVFFVLILLALFGATFFFFELLHESGLGPLALRLWCKCFTGVLALSIILVFNFFMTSSSFSSGLSLSSVLWLTFCTEFVDGFSKLMALWDRIINGTPGTFLTISFKLSLFLFLS